MTQELSSRPMPARHQIQNMEAHQLARRRAINAAHAQARGKVVRNTCIDTTKHPSTTATSARPAVIAGMRVTSRRKISQDFCKGRITCAVLIDLIFSTMNVSFQKRYMKEPLK
jgi:hypothetical protein